MLAPKVLVLISVCVYCYTATTPFQKKPDEQGKFFFTQLYSKIKKNLLTDDEVRPFENKLMRNKTQEEIAREKTKEYWKNMALSAIAEKLSQRLNFSKYLSFFLLLNNPKKKVKTKKK